MKGKIVYWLVALGCLLLAGIWWIWIEGEATGTVRVGTAEERKAEQRAEPFRYTGTYVSFVMPGSFREVSHTLPETGPLKESVYFVGGEGMTTQKVALTLERREEMTFDSSPSYQVRKNNTLYTEQGATTTQAVFLEKKTEGYEMAYFFFWEGYLGVLTYTDSQENSEAKNILKGIQESLEKVEVSEGQEELKSLQ